MPVRNKYSYLIPAISILILIIVMILSLPYPFCPISTWLEKLFVADFDTCTCLCPWWLFLIVQILISCLLSRFFQTKDKKQKSNYTIALIINAIIIILIHHFAHNYYIAKEMFIASVFCPYFILISIVISVISFFFKTKKDEK